MKPEFKYCSALSKDLFSEHSLGPFSYITGKFYDITDFLIEFQALLNSFAEYFI